MSLNSMLAVTVKRPAVTKRAPRSRLPNLLVISAIICIASFLDLLRLGTPSIWMDEAVSIELARQPLVTLFAAYSSGAEPNMILYYLIMHGWFALGSSLHIAASEAFVRFPSAVFAVMATVVVYILGDRFFGQFAALVAACIYMLSGWQLTYAQEARSYSLQLLLVSLTWLGLLMTIHARRLDWRWWSVFVLSGALSVYAQATSALTLLALAAAFAVLLLWPGPLHERAQNAFVPVCVGFITIGALIAPFAYVARHGGHTGWLAAPSIASLLQHVSSLGSKEKLALVAAAILLVVVAISALVALSPWSARPRKNLLIRDGGVLMGGAFPVVLALACWLMIPTAISFLVSLGPIRIFSGRYLVIVLPAVCLLVGVGIASIPWRAPRLGAVAVSAILLLALAPTYYLHAQVEDWRGPAHWLESQYQSGDGLVSYNNVQGCELPFDYYLQVDGSAAHFTADSPGALYVPKNGYGNPAANFMQALNPQALTYFAAHHPRIFFIAGRLASAADVARVKKTEAWLDAHYHFVSQTSSAIVTIRLYDTLQSRSTS